ncbi:MAG TPA: EamA family transporter [Alphaproteobacteria bacterium]|nr:EamA family transporter [Alphaproteobacteria bacterium]
MTPLHIFLGVTMAVLWGFGFVTSKYGAVHMEPLFFLALRFIAVSLLLVWFVRVPRGQMKAVMLFAVSMGAGHFGLFYIALDMGVEASTAAIIWQTQVPMTVVLAAFLLGDRPGWLGVLGIAIAFGGVLVLIGEPRHLGNGLAIGLMLASCVMWAIANIQAKKLTSVEPLALNAWMSVFSAVMLLGCSLIFERGQLESYLVADWRLHGSLAYQVVSSTVLAYWMWYFLLARYPVSRVTGFMLLVPFFGVLSGIFALGEPMTWPTALGGVVTLVGVTLIVRSRRPGGNETKNGARAPARKLG